MPLKIDQPTKPAPDFDKEVLEPLRAKQAEIKSACDAQGGTLDGLNCVPAPFIAAEPIVAYAAPRAPPSYGGLFGSIGYSRPGGNCVNEPGINNPGYGNPSDWPATSWQPWIGGTALWTYNHAGVVTGIWSNGDIEVRHQNWSGPSMHRFSRSTFRGFR